MDIALQLLRAGADSLRGEVGGGLRAPRVCGAEVEHAGGGLARAQAESAGLDQVRAARDPRRPSTARSGQAGLSALLLRAASSERGAAADLVKTLLALGVDARARGQVRRS